jgi:hypothetical protein
MKVWLIVLAIWLLVYGAASVLRLSFDGMPILMGVMAIADGILIFMDK